MVIFLLLTALLFPGAAYAGEECSAFHGICRQACLPGEKAEVGAFLDCTDKEECCVKREMQKDQEKAVDGPDEGNRRSGNKRP